MISAALAYNASVARLASWPFQSFDRQFPGDRIAKVRRALEGRRWKLAPAGQGTSRPQARNPAGLPGGLGLLGTLAPRAAPLCHFH